MVGGSSFIYTTNLWHALCILGAEMQQRAKQTTVRTHGEPDSLVRETDNKQDTENSPLDRSKDLSAKQKTNEAK